MPTPSPIRRPTRLALLCLSLAFAAQASAATIDIRSHGAVPDDATDDAAAIRRAIAAATAGDAVTIPAGRFLVSGAIGIPAGIRFLGAGQAASRLVWTGGGGDFLTIQGNAVEIAALTLDGAGRAVNTGIFAYSSRGHSIHHVTIQDIAGDGGLGIRFTGDAPSAANGVTDSTIADCTIRNIALASEWGGGIRMSWGSSRNRVLRNIVDGTGRGGIFGNDDSTDLVVIGNTVTRSGLASTRLGIELWGRCHRGLIEDNRIDHWLSLDSSDFSALRRNTVADPTGWGFLGLEVIAQDVVVVDNLVDGGQDIGISISNHAANKHMFFGSNTVRGMRAFGAQMYAEGDGISRLYFYKNRILDTQVTAMYTGRGFLFNSGGAKTTSVVFEANEFSGNRDHGIDWLGDADQVTAFGNRITNNTAVGVTGYPGVDLDWHDNVVSGNGDNGQPTPRGYANRAPVASFTCPATATVGQTITCTGMSTDTDGSISHVLWDLGAGIARIETSPAIAYQAAGTYRITLIAWDDRGRAARAERSIVVGSAPPPTPTPTPESPKAPSEDPDSATDVAADTGSPSTGCGLGAGLVALIALACARGGNRRASADQ
ncbi:MAG: right-handed parallel beta-helix repeat-containing protein [Planctomycetes bacterium]|nr:right-handed parallel beta-helix repeat-containing protein [Planctomycetota bacterium]